MIYDIFVNCKWVATRWQLYSTHLHTNNTQNDTKQTIHRTAQKNNTKILEQCGPWPDLSSYTLALALQLRKKHIYIYIHRHTHIYIYTYTHMYVCIYTLLCIYTCDAQNLFTIIIHYHADSQSEHLNIFLLFLRPAVGLSASCEAALLMQRFITVYRPFVYHF